MRGTKQLVKLRGQTNFLTCHSLVLLDHRVQVFSATVFSTQLTTVIVVCVWPCVIWCAVTDLWPEASRLGSALNLLDCILPGVRIVSGHQHRLKTAQKPCGGGGKHTMYVNILIPLRR